MGLKPLPGKVLLDIAGQPDAWRGSRAPERAHTVRRTSLSPHERAIDDRSPDCVVERARLTVTAGGGCSILYPPVRRRTGRYYQAARLSSAMSSCASPPTALDFPMVIDKSRSFWVNPKGQSAVMRTGMTVAEESRAALVSSGPVRRTGCRGNQV